MSRDYGFAPLPGALWDAWPKSGAGEPEPPKLLAHRQSNDLSDRLLVNMLQAYGIPALMLAPGDGAFGKVVLGMSGTGSDIYVPESLYKDAKELMEGENNDELPDGI
ncbi:MAG: hypothetical protein IJ617_09475 [Oscillospiraceae bacterium]|nr:hypothetical protein [Oscillospiraceae bacterium]